MKGGWKRLTGKRLAAGGWTLLGALLLNVAVAAPTTDASATLLKGDAAIVAARAAFDKKNAAAFTTLDVGDHVLLPYVEYWRLLTVLQTASPSSLAGQEDAVRTFLKRWADTPLAQPLQAAWLKALGKTQNWTLFALDYPPAEEDAELQCYGIQYRMQRDADADESVVAAARTLWNTGKTQPDACAPVFDALLARGALTAADVRARYVLAVEAMNMPLVRALWKKLPVAERSDERTFARAESQPQKYLAGKPSPKDKGAHALLIYALERAARQDVEQTRRLWLALRDRWPQADQRYGNARIAYQAARNLHPDAHRFFEEAGNTPLNGNARLWRIRAALRAGDGKAALAGIEALPSAERDSDTWLYWKARCLEQSDAPAVQQQAQALYGKLAAQPTYYGFLAGERLGTTPTLPPRPRESASSETLNGFLSRPAVRRIIKLNALDMRNEMLREWRYLVRNLSDEELLLASQAMLQQGLYDRSIAAAERTVAHHDFGLRYPQPFADAFKEAAQNEDVDIDWLFAVARQESRFVPDIVSSAGAIGLMQLIPRTARWVAKKTETAGYSTDRLSEATLNARFGAFYLKHCLDALDGSLALAAAAYNAGPGRARAWRAKAPADGDLWVESIPFDETRDYVKKVLANAKVYALQRDAVFSMSKTLAIVSAPPQAGEAALDPAVDNASADGRVDENGAPTAGRTLAKP